MKVMVVTPYFTYETFAEGDNPLPEARAYDVSTPEKLKAMKIRLILEETDLLWRIEPPVEPKEPTLSLSQLKDANTVARTEAEYRASYERWLRDSEKYDQMEAFLSSTASDLVDADDELVEELFGYLAPNAAEGGFARFYLYEVQEV